MAFTLAYHEGRVYRFSSERRVSGRPAIIEYQNARNEWRPVRNVDKSDAVWRWADGLDPIGSMLIGRQEGIQA